jgi:GT2 family glycosyltransferase
VYYGPDSRGTYEKLLFSGNCISTSAVVVARKCLDEAGGFREDAEIVTAEDYDLWLRLAQQGARIGFLSELLGIYRLHSGNQSGAVVRNMNAVLSVVRHHFVHTGSPRYRIRRREALVYYSGARGLQDAGKHGEAWSLFLKALSLWPVEPKFYAAMLLNALRQRIG